MIELLGRKRKKRSTESDEERRHRRAEASKLAAEQEVLLQYATPQELAALDSRSDELSHGRRRRKILARIRRRMVSTS